MTAPKSANQQRTKSRSAAHSGAKTAKLFMNGRSQAVLLPRRFRFEGKEVAIRRDPATGDVVLASPENSPSRSLEEWFELFDSLDIPQDFFKREVHVPCASTF